MFRVLIADDHPLFRAALRQVIEGMFGEFEIFEASTLDEALHVAGGGADLDLDAMLLDLQMPGSSGFSGLVALRNAAPAVKRQHRPSRSCAVRSPTARRGSSRSRSPRT